MSKLLTMQENTRGTPGIPGVSFNFQRKQKEQNIYGKIKGIVIIQWYWCI